MQKEALFSTPVPVQLFSVANTTGELIPLTFRYEDRDHGIRRIRIASILSHREAATCGIPHIVYICEAEIDPVDLSPEIPDPFTGKGSRIPAETPARSFTTRIFELRYYILTHKWTLYRILS